MSKELEKCPLCDFAAIISRFNIQKGIYHVECPRCKNYLISKKTVSDRDIVAKVNQSKHLLSGITRELYENDKEPPEFYNSNIDDYIEKHYLLPEKNNIREQSQKILNFIGNKTEHFGDNIQIELDRDYPIAYAKNSIEFIELIKLLEASNYIELPSKTTGPWSIKLSIDGWDSVKMSLKEDNKKQAFIAVWFEGSTNQKINAIKKIVKDSGHEARCLKGEHFSEPIYLKALSEIRKSKFIIADLTGMRHSVFFEVGFAYALGKDIIYVYNKDDSLSTEEKSRLEFYVKHYQCHEYKTIQELETILTDAIGARIVA